MAKSYRGLYRPTNPKKYVGNTQQIVYRSLLERRFMRYCDLNTDILYWASEELAVRYYSPLDKKYHRYFPDFIVKTINNEKYMIEIKPSRQAVKPKPPKKKTKSYMRESFEYIKNQAKWQAAKVYCEDKGMQFKIITEKDLGQY
ncbi:TnsA endonuclease N-terminal domain-containing protein [bacterium]|nr:TnsA endonuclease N-terminal domain-containing protein [bacterium]